MTPKTLFLIVFLSVAFMMIYATTLPVSTTYEFSMSERIKRKNCRNKEKHEEANHEHRNKIEESFNSSYMIPKEKLAVIQGTGSLPKDPIKPVIDFDNDPSAPPIDGDPRSTSQLFTFAFNKSSPECCQDSGGLTSSKGCVCLTEKQKAWLGTRGGNSQFLPEL